MNTMCHCNDNIRTARRHRRRRLTHDMFIEELVRGNDPMQLSKDDRVLCTLVQLSPHCSRRGSTAAAAAVVPIRRD